MESSRRSGICLEPTVTSLLKIYEKLAICKYEKLCAITKLSLENLAPIFQLLETKDRINIRLVCKSFRDAVDQFVGIHVNLDQGKIDLRERWYPITMPPPGASSLRLWSQHSPKYLDHVLKKCDLVTEVQFAGQISLSSVTKILTRCKNLRKISFTDRAHMYSSIMPVRLSQLHTLDLGCPGYSTDYVGEDAIASTLWMTYEMILRKLIAPALKIFRVYFCCVEECSILHRAIVQILRFLAAQEFVEEFSLNLHHRYERFTFLENDVNYKRFRLDIPKKILRSIQLKRIQIETMDPAFKIWDPILPAQKFLTHLDMVNRNRRWFYYSKIIYNNYQTLRDVRLHNIAPRKIKTLCLDVSIFSACKTLETLFLSKFENSTQEIVYCYPNEKADWPFLDMETSLRPELENLDKLPQNLKNLHLQGLAVSTQELCDTFGRLRNLQLLELQLLGYHHPEGNYEKFNGKNLGVNVKVLHKILENCRSLDTLFIEEFENEWTNCIDFRDSVNEINHVPGEGYFPEGNYYGILICNEIKRNNGKLTRAERMHLWDVRLSQYYRHTNRRRHTVACRKNGHHENESDWEMDRYNHFNEEKPYRVDPVISETSLLEILDKENGQLEKIHRMLNDCQTPPPITPNKLKAEETRRYAERYCSTLYSAIPNYHKASRILEEISNEP